MATINMSALAKALGGTAAATTAAAVPASQGYNIPTRKAPVPYFLAVMLAIGLDWILIVEADYFEGGYYGGIDPTTRAGRHALAAPGYVALAALLFSAASKVYNNRRFDKWWHLSVGVKKPIDMLSDAVRFFGFVSGVGVLFAGYFVFNHYHPSNPTDANLKYQKAAWWMMAMGVVVLSVHAIMNVDFRNYLATEDGDRFDETTGEYQAVDAEAAIGMNGPLTKPSKV